MKIKKVGAAKWKRTAKDRIKWEMLEDTSLSGGQMISIIVGIKGLMDLIARGINNVN